MRVSNELGLSALDMSVVGSQNGSAILVQNCVSFSVQSVSTSTGVGVIKVQVSNDSVKDTPTNWTDLASATINVTAASTLILAKTEICYQWIRLVYTRTSGSGTLNARVKTIGF